MGHADRYDIADEYMEVCYKLWEASWEEDAVRRDRAGRIYADPARVHPIDHAGAHYTVAGPHLCEPSPQRTPVLFQAGASPRGRAFAARHAEGVFVGGYSNHSVRANVDDLRARAAAFGRDPRSLTLMPPCNLVIGRTAAEAEAKVAEFQRCSSADGYLAHRFGSGMDLTRHPRDATIASIIAQGGPGADHMARYPFPEGTTVGQIIDDAGRLDRRFLFASGTPQQVADTLEGWAEALDVDGFMLAHMSDAGQHAGFRRPAGAGVAAARAVPHGVRGRHAAGAIRRGRPRPLAGKPSGIGVSPPVDGAPRLSGWRHAVACDDAHDASGPRANSARPAMAFRPICRSAPTGSQRYGGITLATSANDSVPCGWPAASRPRS